MTRERNPDNIVLQAAYGILDKYKISRTFFVKTDQDNCDTKGDAEAAHEAEDSPNAGYDIVVDDETVEEENEVPEQHTYQQTIQTGPGFQSVILTEYFRQNQPDAANATVAKNATNAETKSPTTSTTTEGNLKKN